MEWSNQIGSRERKPWLLLIKNGRITPFAGESLPALLVLAATDQERGDPPVLDQ